MRKIVMLLGAAALWPASAYAQATLEQDAATFGVRESIGAVDLSPSGQKVAYIQPVPNIGPVAYIADVETGAVKPFLRSSSKADQLRWCAFVTDARLICRYGGSVRDEGVIIPYSRLIAVNSDGSQVKELGQQSSWWDARIRQFDGSVVDWLPGGGGAILMAREYVPEAGRTGSNISRGKDGLGLDRIDTLTLSTQPVERPRKGVDGYMTDGRGNVRLVVLNERTGAGDLTGRSRIDFRTAGSRDWKTLVGFGGEAIVPLAVDATSDSLYALKKLNGRQALYRIRLTETPSAELVASHPRVDIDDIVRSAHGRRVIGYSFAEDKRETIYFDAESKALAKALSKALPGLPLIHFVGASQDGSKSLLFGGSDSDPGRYYRYDHSAKQLSELFLVRPELEKRQMATVKPVSVKVADGTSVPAYLTLPPGKEAKNLPAVVLPHGGPSARDEWGFDWLSQFLAARGYAVIQPNYRGSSGFGDQWLVENGFKSWKTSIGDITGSIKWLVEQGIADPNRLAVVGWSYGGYAALQAAATEPGLFKAVTAIAPVTDLGLLKSDAANYTSGRMVAQFVGAGPHIVQGSPLRQAALIKAPVLLAHGDMDLNVTIDHSLKMESALRSGGTSVELLRFKGLDHQIDDSAARRQMLVKIGQLLERSIGR